MAGAEGDDAGAVLDHIVTQFGTYEEYLDSQITTQDLFYLENEEMARQLVELGFRGSGEVLKREDFIARKLAAEASRNSERQQQKILSSAGKELKDNFLKALAEREEANRNGKMSSIIFIRDRNARGQEVSAYIDYAHRLKVDEFDVYFSGKKKLFPRRSDLRLKVAKGDHMTPGQCNRPKYESVAMRLNFDHVTWGCCTGRKFEKQSFYNWDRNLCCMNSSPNYQVIAENACGLLLKNKSDRKIINVDPKAFPGDNTTRVPIKTDLYLQVVIYDHVLRRKI